MKKISGFTPLEINGININYNGNVWSKKYRKNHFLSLTGFTLLEVLVVVVIVGILAALAIPQYRKASETSKAAEAYNNLNAIRKAEWVYYNKYADFTSTLDNLSIENPNRIPSVIERGNRCFNYFVIVVGPASNFGVYATRISGPYNGNVISMNANGNIDESGWLQ